MKILSVVGTRPQLIKAAAVQPILRARHHEVFVDTGQHWDDALAGAFFAELGLAPPDRSLGLGGGGHGEQTGRMLLALEPILEMERPDVVLIYGDTNSTLAGALAAAKVGIPVAHVEAGLRSFDRRMPEELNRVLADHLATWRFAPTPTAVANLAAEGIVEGVVEVGDVLQDLAARVSAEVRDPAVLGGISTVLATGIAAGTDGAAGAQAGGATPAMPATPAEPVAELRSGRYLFATVHRAENRDPAALRAWTGLLGAVSRPDRPVVLALHPGTRAALDAEGIPLPPSVRVVEPQGYRTTLALQLHAAAVLTDSGGIQREAAWLGVPCLVLRSTTEWVEAVADSGGRMVVIGLDAQRAVDELDRLAPAAAAEAMARARAASLHIQPVGAAAAIVAALEEGVAAREAGR